MKMSAALKKELSDLKEKFGFVEPNSGDLDDESIVWREGKPEYTIANLAFFKGRSMNHASDSLEKIVEDVVKTWEMEATHKIDYSQWTSISDPETFKVSVNGAAPIAGSESMTIGNYNVLLRDVDKTLFDVKQETFESSHQLFRNTFKDGFPWEVISVFSGPPTVAFSWRHWGRMNGAYRGREADGKTYEMHGFCMVPVDEKLKIEAINVYFNPENFLEALEGKEDKVRGGNVLTGTGCPFIGKYGSS